MDLQDSILNALENWPSEKLLELFINYFGAGEIFTPEFKDFLIDEGVIEEDDSWDDEDAELDDNYDWDEHEADINEEIDPHSLDLRENINEFLRNQDE